MTVKWHKQGAAVVGEVLLDMQTPARVVLVGPRAAPKGAVLVCAGEDGQLVTTPFYDCVSRVPAPQLVQVICMQERQFGDSSLPAPVGL